MLVMWRSGILDVNIEKIKDKSFTQTREEVPRFGSRVHDAVVVHLTWPDRDSWHGHAQSWAAMHAQFIRLDQHISLKRPEMIRGEKKHRFDDPESSRGLHAWFTVSITMEPCQSFILVKVTTSDHHAARFFFTNCKREKQTTWERFRSNFKRCSTASL